MHNWSLRLDHIREVAVVGVEGEWLPRLEQLEVEMHIFGRLAFAYQTKTEDAKNEWLADKQGVRHRHWRGTLKSAYRLRAR